MSTRNKIIFYCVAWAAALFATNPSLDYAALIWMFPLGLAAMVYAPWSQGGWGAIAFGTAIYVVHAVLYFRAKRRALVIVLAVALIAILICNVSGCRAMMKSR